MAPETAIQSVSNDLASSLYLLVSRIDNAVEKQLHKTLSNNAYCQLKATWQGLYYLIANPNNDSQSIVKILDLSWDELVADVTMRSIQRSSLHKLVFKQELDTLGGLPFGAISFDYGLIIPEQPLVISVLSNIGQIGQQALCPMIFSLSHQWLAADTEILAYSPTRLERFYANASMAGYRNLRNLNQSRFIGIVWPGFYLRRNVFDKEVANHKQLSDSSVIHISGGTALMACIIREFDLYGWFAGLQAWGPSVSGGAVLPSTNNYMPKALVSLSESLEESYSSFGLMPLSSTWLEDMPALFCQNMLHIERKEQKQCFISLACVLMSCRIGHYLKVMLRDFAGSTKTASECRTYLSGWLLKYCATSSLSTEEFLSRYPIREAKVQVNPVPGQPGSYTVDVHIVPCLAPGTATEELIVNLVYDHANTSGDNSD